MGEITSWHEYGYRLADGTESWQINYGTDGSWTSFDRGRNIGAIDMYDGSEVKAIYAALDKAGVEGVAIRKLVTHTEGETYTVPRETGKK